jgi:hypothetical protein
MDMGLPNANNALGKCGKMKECEVVRRLDRQSDRISMDSIWGAFETLSQSASRYKVSFATYFCTDDPLSHFKAWHPEGFEVKVDEEEDFLIFRIRRTIKRADIENGMRVIEGSFGFHNLRDNVWIAFTSEDPDFFDNGLIRYLDAYRPSITSISLSSHELRKIFEAFEESTKGEVLIKKAVLYSHEDEGDINYKKKKMNELFNIAENEDDYVDKVEYFVKANGRQLLHAFASREGISYYYSGEIKYFRGHFLQIMCDIATKKSSFLSGRERQVSNSALKPMDIVYSQNVFTSRSDNFKLINSLSNLSRAGVAVMHRNPYLHAVVLDFDDGSTFDVFVTEGDRVRIVPGFRSSVHALMRLCEQIFKDFHEGEIADAPRERYELADFISTPAGV